MTIERDLPPVGFEKASPLPKPRCVSCAAQVREMGLSVGDVIVGREYDHEAELTVLFVGRQVAAFSVRRRRVDAKWSSEGESGCWCLDSRRWYLRGAA